jgi:hypothetical protein
VAGSGSTKKQEGNKRMTLLTDWSALVSTNCECSFTDEEGNEIPEISPDYCNGCGEWMQEDATALLQEWLKRNDYPSAVIIRGAAMGWQRLSGYALIRQFGTVKLSADTLKKLTLNGDFTLDLKLTGRACHVVRYSHDEPTGASFELEAFTPCDGWSECQATEGIREYEGQNLCAYCHEIEEAN